MVISTFSQKENVSSKEIQTTVEGDKSSQVFATEWIYGGIAVLSLLLNSLLCLVMIRKPSMLKRPHNILLFTLALADLLTGL